MPPPMTDPTAPAPRHQASQTLPVAGGDGDLGAVAGRVLAELISRSHLMRPAEVTAALAQAAVPLGVSAARVYLADLQQRRLVPLPAGEVPVADTLPIDSTLAGRAYQTVTIQSAP